MGEQVPEATTWKVPDANSSPVQEPCIKEESEPTWGHILGATTSSAPEADANQVPDAS